MMYTFPYLPLFKSSLFTYDLIAVLPEIFILFALCVLFYAVYYSAPSTTLKPSALKWVSPPLLTYNLSIIAIYILSLTVLLVANNPFTYGTFFYNAILLDPFSSFCKLSLLLASICCFLMSLEYIKNQIHSFEYVILVLLSIFGMMCLISAQTLLSFYLALELQSLAFFVLAAIKRNSEFSVEAGLKYFILGALSTGLFLFGASLLYGFSGTIEFSELAKLVQGSELPISFAIGLLFIGVSFLFKMAAVPFHMWSPDVYEGAPTPVTAFFAIAPKLSLFAVFFRFFYTIGVAHLELFIFCSIFSIVIGSLGALSQKKIKRLLAFSSITHVGYILIGFCCSNIEGIQSSWLHLILYVIMNIQVFTLLMINVQRDTVKGVQQMKYIGDFSALLKTNPLLAISLACNLFSLAGVPPLAGFFGKYYLLTAAVTNSYYLLAFVGALMSAIACIYYIRLVKILYFEKPTSFFSIGRLSQFSSYILGLTNAFLIGFFIYPQPLLTSLYYSSLFLV